MSSVVVAILLLLGFLAVTAASVGLWQCLDRARLASPRPTWDAFLLWTACRIYCRLVHRVRFEGLMHLPTERPAGPLIIVANHTAGVDPALIQAACPFEIRWMMMSRMNVGPLRRLTDYLGTILVEQNGADLASTRAALRHLKDGGVVGIFPEGGIERPAGVLKPFHAGVGFLIAKSRASVLPVWISGTPFGEEAMATLFRPSRSRVVFGPIRRFDERDPVEITRSLRAVLAEMSGWPDDGPAVAQTPPKEAENRTSTPLTP